MLDLNILIPELLSHDHRIQTQAVQQMYAPSIIFEHIWLKTNDRNTLLKLLQTWTRIHDVKVTINSITWTQAGAIVRLVEHVSNRLLGRIGDIEIVSFLTIIDSQVVSKRISSSPTLY